MTRPKLMLLDEPSAALSPALVEQHACLTLNFSDRGYILDQGRMVLTGRADDLLRDEAMAQLYLGRAKSAR